MGESVLILHPPIADVVGVAWGRTLGPKERHDLGPRRSQVGGVHARCGKLSMEIATNDLLVSYMIRHCRPTEAGRWLSGVQILHARPGDHGARLRAYGYPDQLWR